MRLSGIEIRNYRSIGSQPVVLKPWKKCNILIGQNNVGKSNVIRAVEKISNIFSDSSRGWAVHLDNHENHMLNEPNEFSFNLHFKGGNDSEEDKQLIHWVGTNDFSFTFSTDNLNPGRIKITELSLANITDLERANELFLLIKRQSPRSRYDLTKNFLHYANEFFEHYFSIVPPIYIIPEFRQIQPGEEYRFNGQNLIGLLFEYQNPALGKDQDREKFNHIEQFVRHLLHLPTAKLEIPHTSDTIVLTNEGLRLDLKSYGTGVHELIILITAILSIENAICCIEEPEIHLHPTLQREFIQFIIEHTNNQYLISTHSPTFINAHTCMPADIGDQIQVFHLQLENKATVGRPVLEDDDSLLLLSDLGVRASDLLQANCVIWVEGPSDRIYLNRWLELVAPDLIEGLHYSIMFYGGRLLSHLSVTRDKVPEELVDILRINQRAIVLFDSDRKKPRARLNATKLRVRAECDTSGGICWVTDGREIENYLAPEVVAQTCQELFGMGIELTIGQYDRFEDILDDKLVSAGAQRIHYASHKVKYAREFVKYFTEESIGNELKKHLVEIAEKIRQWTE